MTDTITKLNNKLWRIKGGTPTPFSDFTLSLEQIDKTKYPGRCADIFFGNDKEGVFKWLHYLPIYDRIFGKYVDQPIRFLEIGVFRGGSLNLWREFFGPAATIYGVDIDPACAAFDGISGQVRIGSQDDPEFLRRVVEEMGGVDVVLDDGSHVSSHQRASFEALFPLVSDGGLYVIEDLHTAYWPSYEGGLGRPGTGIEILKDQVDAMHQHYYTQGVNTSENIPQIESIQFFDSIAVVEKRTQLPRGCVMVPAPK
ncbi:hypothetical protein CHX26_00245 [Porphyrobacter sp. HT-58-2]|uniref:class I SAM-dependent methyltransferase n=1 Tax=Porphyrobacter sp. HT-58-2 TaxID=2023229 RepID=UPI000CDCA6EF|nr:class I SAM-dependent methyltransferase [Porphyrobacter sp. HT-58-2]AUX68151.1 hypothetical protein CHX26_00245 [Porphyrobacter sp. HT-58-2]